MIPAAFHDLRHSHASIASSLSLFRLSGSSNFMLLKTRSTSPDIAGIDKMSRAIQESRGDAAAWSWHHWITLVMRVSGLRRQYSSYSSMGCWDLPSDVMRNCSSMSISSPVFAVFAVDEFDVDNLSL